MGAGTFVPTVAKPGDIIRSSDWNAALSEIARLGRELARVQRQLGIVPGAEGVARPRGEGVGRNRAEGVVRHGGEGVRHGGEGVRHGGEGVRHGGEGVRR